MKTFPHKRRLRVSIKPLTQILRNAKRVIKMWSCVTIVAMFHAALFPYLEAAQGTSKQPETDKRIVLKGSPEEQLNQALLKVQEIADSKQHTIAKRLADESGVFDTVLDFFGLSEPQLEDIDSLEQLNTLLAGLNQTALEQFQQTENQLREKGLPEVILQRHLDTVAHYEQQFAELSHCLTEVLQADSLEGQGAAMDTLDQLMAPQKLKKRHQTVDPNNLPWGTPDASKVRKPARTPEELSEHTGLSPVPQGVLLAANTLPPNIFDLAGGPMPEDLAETPDIQLTDAIRDLAENQLGDDSIAIYNWVRNNIEFIPSYGSIQGADYTLQHGKGNAFDTASLLIALYRASNIPARYAYGTVRIPVDKVMNWVGGVEVPEAAQQLLGQGGIPNLGLIRGGVITHIEMEHVWVEAWVDYFPSRAAKHDIGDQWIPLDPSFKQYEFTEGEDLETNVPFDAQGLVDQITQTAIIDETAGFVQGVDQETIEAALIDYQQQIEDYINTQNPDATVGEVLGTQKVIVQEYQQLAAGLPYELVVRTHNYSELPDNLRHKFRYTIGTESFGRESNRLITFEQSLPELAGKKHALSFRPATQADEDLINSFIPEPDPVTGEIDPSQLPSTLPGYLISLTAEFTQDGEVIHSASAGTMGGELYETLALWSPTFGWEQAVNHPTAGEYRAIGLDLQGLNPEESIALENSVRGTLNKLEALDDNEIVNLSKQELVGDLLYSVIYNYFSINNTLDYRNANINGIVSYRLPSFGLYGSSLQTSYWFGLPRNVSFTGLVMDVDRIASQATSKDNVREKTVEFIKSTGVISSAMEHLIPETMLSTEEAPAEGVSAIKALALAETAGQKIWTIDQNNLDLALAEINLDAAIENDIRNSVLAGKVATAHEAPVPFANSSATGYLLIDPETGAGAYLISGGTSGGILEWLDDNAYWLGGLAFVLGVAGINLPVLAVIGTLLGIAVAIAGIYAFASENPEPTLLGAYIAIMLMFVVLGFFLGVPGVLFSLWIHGFLADGAIRAAQDAIDAIRNRQMP